MSSPSRSSSQPAPHSPHSFIDSPNSPLSTTTYSPHSTTYSPHSLGGGDSDEGEGYGLMERGRREDTPPAPCSVLCGPRSCATLPPSLARPPVPTSADSGGSKGRRVSKLWGLRGLVKMFRRKVRRRGQGDSTGGGENSSSPDHSPQQPPTTMRARSASELLGDANSRPGCGPYNQGISVSHDSVFSPDSPPDPPPHHAAPVPLTLATRGVNMSELKAALRRRVVSTDSPAGGGGRGRAGEEDGSGDDDPGLPRSPPTSPTTLDVLNHGLKSVSRATQSTCSDGSLLSMGSSELEDDSPGSLHSSKHSLGEGRLLQVVDHEPVAGEAPGLNHTAARHKIAVRPRRTHALSRPRKQQVPNSSVLPPTLEVNEEGGGGRSVPHPLTAPIQNPPQYHPGSFGGPPPSTQPLVTQPLAQHKMPPPPHFDPLNYHPDPHHLQQQQGSFLLPQVSGGAPYLSGEPPPIVSQPSSQQDQRSPHPPSAADLDGPVPGDADRREEPLLSRLFGSVRAGRRRSRSRQDGLEDDDREASVSPMRRDGRYGVSSAKTRTESPATRVPLLGRSNSRGRQQLVQQHDGEYLRQLQQQEEEERARQIHSEQQQRHQQEQQQLEMHHQHQLQMKIKARSVENRKLDEKTDYEARSSSVEGRIEGHELEKQIAAHEKKPPLNVQIASYPERGFYSPVKNESSVKKAKSFREMGKSAVVVRRDSSRRSWFGHDSGEYPHGAHARLSASYDSLDDKATAPAPQQQTPSQSVVSLVHKESKRSSAASKSVLSPALSSTLSSTDSLTTTEIPGVYIRPLSQYKRGPSDDSAKTDSQSYFCTQQTQFSGYNDPIVDNNSGPLSLDSSITLIPRDDDNMRKTSSSDHVSANMVHMRKHSSDNLINPAAKIIPVTSMSEQAYVNTGSSQSQRKQSASGSSITEIQILPEYQGKFSSYVPGPASVLRSMSLSTSDTSATCGVLNRRASSADELEPLGNEAREMNSPAAPIRTRYRKRESSLSRTSSQDPEPPAVPEFMRIQLNKVENKPQRVIYTTEDDLAIDSFAAPNQSVQEENAQDNTSLKSKDSFNTQTEGEDEEAEPENSQQRRSVSSRASRRESTLSQSSQSSCAGDSSDDVVLRRPLRREKSLVLDTTPVPKKEDEPELFKVFARRSFKVPECFPMADEDEKEEEQTRMEDSSEMMPSLSSQMTGVTKINPIYSTPTPPRTPIISSSFSNKFSVGSPAIPFKHPVSSTKESPPSSPAPSVCTSMGSDVQLRDTANDHSFIENNVTSALAKTEISSSVHRNVSSKAELTCSQPSKNVSCSHHVTTSPVTNTVPIATSKITIRPMSANREASSVSSIISSPFPASEPATSPFNSSFSSAIISRVSSGSPDNRPNPSTTPPKQSALPPTLNNSSATDNVTVNSNSVTPVSWPPKSFAPKGTPPTSQVKGEQLGKYTTPKKTPETIETDTTTSVPENDQEVSSADSTDIDDSVSQVQSVRRKFMTAGSSSSKSFTSPSSTLQSSSSSSSSTARSTSVPAASPPVIEARNTVPVFTVTVRSTQSPSTRHSSFHAASRSHSSAGSSPAPSVGSSSPAVASHHRHSIGGAYVPHPRQRQPPSSSPSPPPPGKRSPALDSDPEAPPPSSVPHSAILQSALNRHLSSPAASPSPGATGSGSSVSPVPSGDGLDSSSSGEDWRALVKQRREDRLKQSKSVESLDEPMDARPSGTGGGGGGGSSSRSSKVLEMASNFQKLQVA